jgi:hypothetical protein
MDRLRQQPWHHGRHWTAGISRGLAACLAPAGDRSWLPGVLIAGSSLGWLRPSAPSSVPAVAEDLAQAGRVRLIAHRRRFQGAGSTTRISGRRAGKP